MGKNQESQPVIKRIWGYGGDLLDIKRQYILES